MTLLLTYVNNPTVVKPTDYTWKNLRRVITSVEQHAEIIGKGQAWLGCALSIPDFEDEHWVVKAWQAQTVVALDYDNKYNEDADCLTLLWTCRHLGIRPAFWYHTFSSTEERPAFRLCFACDMCELFVDYKLFNQALKNLNKALGGQADKRAISALKLWQGTNKLVCYDNWYTPFKVREWL